MGIKLEMLGVFAVTGLLFVAGSVSASADSVGDSGSDLSPAAIVGDAFEGVMGAGESADLPTVPTKVTARNYWCC